MRVLLEQECAAVAGGHEDDACEHGVTVTFTVAGGVIGGAVGAGAGAAVGTVSLGPFGTIPGSVAGGVKGAIGGGAGGALLGELINGPMCACIDWLEEQGPSERQMMPYFLADLSRWQASRFGQTIREGMTGPHQLVVDTSAGL